MSKTENIQLAEPYKTIILRLLDELLKFFGDKLVSLIVYGSVARGDYRKDSDIDLLVIIDGLPKSKFKRVELFLEVEMKLDSLLNKLFNEGYAVTFSPVIKTPEEACRVSPLYLDMVEDAVIIYDKNDFFKKIIDKLRVNLKRLGAERVWIGNRWYWRLKKDYKFGEVINIE